MKNLLNFILNQSINELLYLRSFATVKQAENNVKTIEVFTFDSYWSFVPVPIIEECVYCNGIARGNYAIHRDGFGIGPEVDLCDECGQDPEPTLSEIWDRIAQ